MFVHYGNSYGSTQVYLFTRAIKSPTPVSRVIPSGTKFSAYRTLIVIIRSYACERTHPAKHRHISSLKSGRVAVAQFRCHLPKVDIRTIRAALARRFLIKLKRATHRSPPELFIPQAKRVLVVAPHMDDEVIACGGTLLQLIERGAEVHVVFASDSSTGAHDPAIAAELRSIRQQEALRVRDYAGFAGTAELGFPDGRLHDHEAELSTALASEFLRIEPDLIFCPFPGDGHSDHMSCSWATARAARLCRWKGWILAYEVWTTLWPNVAVDITSVAERKAEAIRLYASQVLDRDYAAGALGLNRYRGLSHSVAYAEAFYRSDLAGFERLTALLDEL